MATVLRWFVVEVVEVVVVLVLVLVVEVVPVAVFGVDAAVAVGVGFAAVTVGAVVEYQRVTYFDESFIECHSMNRNWDEYVSVQNQGTQFLTFRWEAIE